MKVGVYLTFDGNCKEAMNYYKGIFGGDFDWCATWADSPMKDKTPKDMMETIMHCSLPLNQTFQLMGCDRHPEMHKEAHNIGNHSEISLTPDSRADLDRLHKALSEGGSVGQAPHETFWKSYFGSCTDKFGNKWMLDIADASCDGSAELKKAAVALREAAKEANEQAEALEKLAQEPKSKKAKTEE